MRIRLISGAVTAAGVAVAFGAMIATHDADARGRAAHSTSLHAAYSSSGGVRGHLHSRFADHFSNYRARHFGYASRLQCVPFARENTGIELSGNAVNWWENADGVYQRGARPEVGSVLNFRANGRMRMGHVAVVSNVIDARNIEIDHANWGGGVHRNTNVVDVSPNNDWTAVRVALDHTGDFGSVYPTFGFIYDRPDNGVLVANNNRAPAPFLSAAPRDLRPAADRIESATAMQDNEEVAEADDDVQPHFRRVGHHGRFAGRTSAHGAARISMAHVHGLHAHHGTRHRI